MKKAAFFSFRQYEKPFYPFGDSSFSFFSETLSPETLPLARGFSILSCFVNDRLSAPVLEDLRGSGLEVVLLRCAGFNNIDLDAASRLGIQVARVPAYSPYAVAEHAVALLLTLNRKIHKAYNRVRENNFSLEGLTGFDLNGSVVGVMGTGKIGAVFCRIMLGFGCRVLAFDPQPDPELSGLGVSYVPLSELFSQSDILSLHLPLTPETRYIISAGSLQQMKPGSILINTSRGGLVDTRAVIHALKEGKLGGLALDVYEEEAGIFFIDHSWDTLLDDTLSRLMTFPNVLITSHQGFLTRQALENIAGTTLRNVRAWESGQPLLHLLGLPAGA